MNTSCSHCVFIRCCGGFPTPVCYLAPKCAWICNVHPLRCIENQERPYQLSARCSMPPAAGTGIMSMGGATCKPASCAAWVKWAQLLLCRLLGHQRLTSSRYHVQQLLARPCILVLHPVLLVCQHPLLCCSAFRCLHWASLPRVRNRPAGSLSRTPNSMGWCLRARGQAICWVPRR